MEIGTGITQEAHVPSTVHKIVSQVLFSAYVVALVACEGAPECMSPLFELFLCSLLGLGSGT